MKNIIYICIFSLFFVSCNNKDTKKQKTENEIATESYKNYEVAQDIIYIKDKRVNLCYGVFVLKSTYKYSSVSIACVPCDSVEKLLQKNYYNLE